MGANDIIQQILDYLGMNPTQFSKRLGLDRAQAIFDIQTGKTKTISARMATKIKSAFPAFSKNWLLTGEGEMLEYEMPASDFASDKSPQVVKKSDLSGCLQIIENLVLQLSQKDERLSRIEGKLNELANQYGQLASAFEALAADKVVGSEEPKKEVV